MSDGERALLVRIKGRVQGVGYRAFTREEALRCSVTGWVVNCDDGSVEAALYGSGVALGDVIARLRQGPPSAKVEALDVRSTDRGRIDDVPAGGQQF